MCGTRHKKKSVTCTEKHIKSMHSTAFKLSKCLITITCSVHRMCVSRKFFQEGPRENSVCQGRRGVFRGLFLVSLQQMHDCVLSHKTHNRRLKLKHKKTYKKQQLGIAYLLRSLSLISNCTTCNNKIYHINTLMHWYVIHEYHVSHALKYCL